MKSRTFALFVCFVLLLLSVVHAVYYYPILPAMIASHFDIHGQANGWMDKMAFMGVYASLVGFFVLVCFITALLIHMFPAWAINLRNKDYWLAPQRREETNRKISNDLMWVGNATLLLLISCMEIVFRANLRPAWNPGTAFIIIISCYTVLMLIWFAIYLYRFRIPKETQHLNS